MVLVVAERLTGTFYLLVLGVAALVAAVAAYLGGTLLIQVVVAGAISIGGVLWIRARRQTMRPPSMKPLDVGYTVTLESWVNSDGRLARVKYRYVLCEAVVEGGIACVLGEVFAIKR